MPPLGRPASSASRSREETPPFDRRRLLLLLATGVAGYYAGNPFTRSSSASTSTRPAEAGAVATPALPPIPPPAAGKAVEVSNLRSQGDLALTIDDGYDAETVAAYIQFCHDSGVHLTFNPNGMYRRVWEPHSPELRSLIARGQVQIGNHTYNHTDLRRLQPNRLGEEISRNDEWIQGTFGVTSRPWLRPPFGAYDQRVQDVAGSLGFTRILLWNGSLGDSRLLDDATLLRQAESYLTGGTILLGHANHSTVTHLYGEIVRLIRERNLQPKTLDELFGTSRATG
jgi:peptidoglycan/xylan/chitin deacetylase (PgdA/CDA1 family)